MRIHSGIAASARRLTRGALAIGNFDGVHLGHRGLFDAARSAARDLGGPAAALTFEPHPAKLLAPEYAPPRITTLSRKRELCTAAGLDVLVEQSFDRAFAALDPGAFIDLLAKTGIGQVIVGPDFTYGRDRKGSVECLALRLPRPASRSTWVPRLPVPALWGHSTRCGVIYA